jgi:hypothetical protein
MNFELIVPREQEKAQVARLADKYLPGSTRAPSNGDVAVASELMADIVRLASACERLSGIGYASNVIEARGTADLMELAEIRDSLVGDLATYQEQRRARRHEILEILLAFTAGAVASIPALLIFGIPAYFLLKALFWS